MLRWSCSDALEIFEGFEAGAAAMQRLARRRAEFADAFGVNRMATGTTYGPVAAQHLPQGREGLPRRDDAVGLELGAAFGGDPITAPGRGQYLGHSERTDARAPQRILHGAPNHRGCRATNIGRRQTHVERAARLQLDETDQAQIDDVQRRNLRVLDRSKSRP